MLDFTYKSRGPILNFHGLHKSITLRKKKNQFVKSFVVSWYCSVLYRRTYLQIFPYTNCNQIRKPKLKELSFTLIGRKGRGSLEKNSTKLTLALPEGRKGVGFHIQLLPVFHCSYGWKYIWIWNGPKEENKNGQSHIHLFL